MVDIDTRALGRHALLTEVRFHVPYLGLRALT